MRGRQCRDCITRSASSRAWHGCAFSSVEAGGYKYDGKLYGSLSGAAAAAAKKLELNGKSFNGYVFWGLKLPGGRAPLHRLEHLWERYSGVATALLKTDGPDKAPALERLRQHAAQLKALV
jgi:hypothetical protein